MNNELKHAFNEIFKKQYNYHNDLIESKRYWYLFFSELKNIIDPRQDLDASVESFTDIVMNNIPIEYKEEVLQNINKIADYCKQEEDSDDEYDYKIFKLWINCYDHIIYIINSFIQ